MEAFKVNEAVERDRKRQRNVEAKQVIEDFLKMRHVDIEQSRITNQNYEKEIKGPHGYQNHVI